MKKQEITNGSLGLALLRSAGGLGGGIKGLLFLVTQPRHHKELDAGVMLLNVFLLLFCPFTHSCSISVPATELQESLNWAEREAG